MNTEGNVFHPRFYAEREPERLAYVMCDTGEAVTFGQLEARANQGAQFLREHGLKTGDNIVIVMENRREFMELCFAADRAGLYYTTASTHLTVDEITYIIADCGAKLVVTSAQFPELVQRLKHALSSDVALYSVGDQKDALNWNEAIERQATFPILDECQGLDMLYSSGTTGRPKGIKWPLVVQQPGGHTMLLDLLTSLFGYDSQTRYLCPAPLYHAAPLRHTMVTIKMGGTCYIMSKFDAEGSLGIIEREQITHSQWVQTMFVRMLKLAPEVRKSYDTSSMIMAVHAAAPCPANVKHEMIKWWGPIIHEYYAGTENNGFTAITTSEWLAHEGSVGQAKLGILHICNEQGEEVPVGTEGEIFFENGHQFEYHNDPAKTAASTNSKGWTSLGDIGRVDEEGYLYLTDRKSFVIISGGVNIYPQETENVLLDHPAVLDVAVIGVPNEDFGEEVKAVVQLLAGETPSVALQDSLMEHCFARLSSMKCPRSIDFRAELPRTATGKLFKRKLRDEFWPKTTRTQTSDKV